VFCRTKHGAEKVAHRLHNDGIECREIHGNLAQNQRDRVMKSFRGGKFDVLIATDLASRGIDVADISHIINFDIPEDPEVYVHRVGRTARMGAGGKAFTFVTRDQGDELTKVENLINMVIPQATVEGFEPRPTPSDWNEGGPPSPFETKPAAPVPSRFETPASVTIPARPLSIGSKIPVSRRHRRKR
jgi:superfamily II DNA/RNA helicase